MATIIIIISIFSAIRTKHRFCRPEKVGKVARIREGGCLGNSGNARKKTFFFFNWPLPLFGPLCLPIWKILCQKIFLTTVKILVPCPVLSTLWGARWSHQDKLGELGDTPWPQGRLLPIMRSTFWSRKYLWQTKTMRNKHFGLQSYSYHNSRRSDIKTI